LRLSAGSPALTSFDVKVFSEYNILRAEAGGRETLGRGESLHFTGGPSVRKFIVCQCKYLLLCGYPLSSTFFIEVYILTFVFPQMFLLPLTSGNVACARMGPYLARRSTGHIPAANFLHFFNLEANGD